MSLFAETTLAALEETACQGAKRMLAQGLEAEAEAYLGPAKEERDEHRRAAGTFR
jgi:hypothetical protein